MRIRPVSKKKGPQQNRRKKFPARSQRRTGQFPANRPGARPDYRGKKIEAPLDIDFRNGLGVAWIGGQVHETKGKKRAGRPTPINDATLVGHAGELNWLLGSAWADIGWQLQHVRKPDDIRAAFEPLRDSSHRGFLNPFLRLTGEKATAADLRKSRKILQEALARQSQADERHRALLERSQLAEAALSQATPEQREGVVLLAKNRRAELEAAEKALEEAKREVESLEKKLRDQEAYYCRAEVFNFIRSEGYACNPRNLAFAMTGLPHISCRWSVWRCQRLKPKLIELEVYRLIEFISRIWERRRSGDEHALFDLFEAAIHALPKDDYMRTRLAEYWRDFKEAIQTGIQEEQKPGIHPKRAPYMIASSFYKNVARSKTAVDRLLTEQERLNLA